MIFEDAEYQGNIFQDCTENFNFREKYKNGPTEKALFSDSEFIQEKCINSNNRQEYRKKKTIGIKHLAGNELLLFHIENNLQFFLKTSKLTKFIDLGNRHRKAS